MHSLTTAKKRRDAEVVNVGVDHVTCIHNRGNPNLFAFGQSYSRCCGVFVFWLVRYGKIRQWVFVAEVFPLRKRMPDFE